MNAAGLRARALVLRAVRAWFSRRGYLEVPTPSVVACPAMEEHLYAERAAGGFLRTSPEFSLKKVAAAGLPRIYEIGPCWRAREHGPWHRSEFFMIEWYRAGASLADLMDEVASLTRTAARAVSRPDPPEWRRLTVAEVVLSATGVVLHGASVADLGGHATDSWDDAFFRLWVDHVEPGLSGAVFLRDWPASQAALAQIRADGPRRAERFEAYLGGVELANAYLELIDSAEQRARFQRANTARRAAMASPHPVDEALITAVGAMPPTAGIAMGLDRLVASVMGWPDIAQGRAEPG